MTEIDFLYGFLIQILLYNKDLQGNGIFRELFQEEPLKSSYGWVALGLGVFNGFLFLLIFPLLFVQTVNIVKGTTTNQLFAYNVRAI